jgi:hypothetical protein
MDVILMFSPSDYDVKRICPSILANETCFFSTSSM